MTEPRWSSDDVLLADLQAALAQAGVGEADLEAGRSALGARTVDSELAALTYDSLVDDHAAERGAPDAPRRLVFNAGSASVELDVLPDRIVGRLVPGMAADVVVQSRSQQLGRTTADDAGGFTVALAARGLLVRVRCSGPSRTLVTDWVTL